MFLTDWTETWFYMNGNIRDSEKLFEKWDFEPGRHMAVTRQDWEVSLGPLLDASE